MKHEQSSEEFQNYLKRMHLRIAQLERQLADAMNGKLPEDQHVDPSMIMVSSRTRERLHHTLCQLKSSWHIDSNNSPTLPHFVSPRSYS